MPERSTSCPGENSVAIARLFSGEGESYNTKRKSSANATQPDEQKRPDPESSLTKTGVRSSARRLLALDYPANPLAEVWFYIPALRMRRLAFALFRPGRDGFDLLFY